MKCVQLERSASECEVRCVGKPNDALVTKSVKGKSVPDRNTKAYERSGSRVPLIPIFSTRWRSVVKFTPRPL